MNTREDATAAQRSYDFLIGWFMHPLVYGDYPQIMRSNVGSRLPIFSREESELVKGSFDFIGMNYYTIIMTNDNSVSLETDLRDFNGDMATTWISINESVPLGKNPFPNMPWGLKGVLDLFKRVYNNPAIYIYENGQLSEKNASVNDRPRMEYLQSHIGVLLDAVRNGSNTKGYFVWSFIDVFELLFGYEYGFGLYYINFTDPRLTRCPRLSQRWYSGFLKGGNNVAAPGELKDMSDIFPISPMNIAAF